MDASEQMRKRPMAPLLSSLKELGCEITCEREDGHFPFILTATVRTESYFHRYRTQ